MIRLTAPPKYPAIYIAIILIPRFIKLFCDFASCVREDILIYGNAICFNVLFQVFIDVPG